MLSTPLVHGSGRLVAQMQADTSDTLLPFGLQWGASEEELRDGFGDAVIGVSPYLEYNQYWLCQSRAEGRQSQLTLVGSWR